MATAIWNIESINKELIKIFVGCILHIWQGNIYMHYNGGWISVQKFSYIFAMVGMFALFASFAAWLNILRQPHHQPFARRPALDARESKAAMALFAAFGLSLVAAVLAILAWMF